MRMDIGDVVAKSTTVLTPPTGGRRPVTLRELLDTLGPHALWLAGADEERLDEPVGEPVVYGAGEPLHHVGDQIVLLTGVRPGEAEGSLRRVAAAGGRTVVLKAWGHDLSAAGAAAAEAGLTLLGTPDEMAWRHLDALVTAARLAGTTVGENDGAPVHSDLFSLANAIAASLGGPVTIEETDGRIMAYSNLPGQEIDEIRRLAILGRRTPDRPSNAAEYQTILKSPGPVVFESSHPDYASRMAVAVRAGHQTLGVIFVLMDRPRLVDDAGKVLLDAARTTALHLLRSRGSQDPDRARRGEALRGLLAGTLDPAAAASSLGLSPGAEVTVAVVRPAPRPGQRTEAARVADLVALHGEYWHDAAASVLDAGDLVLLLPVSTTTDDRESERLGIRLRRLGTDLATAARRSAEVELLAGFGPVVAGLGQVARGRALANQVVGILERTDTQVATLDDVRSQVVLEALRAGRPTDDEALVLPQVRAVLEHDAAQSTDYARTLLIYLGNFGNILATAEALNVHDNTARYRVRRLTERFGIELGAGDETLVTWLQLRNALDS